MHDLCAGGHVESWSFLRCVLRRCIILWLLLRFSSIAFLYLYCALLYDIHGNNNDNCGISLLRIYVLYLC